MDKKLISLFNRIENERFKVVDLIKNLSVDDLNKAPAEGKWSILQIIFHLVKTEKIAVISIQKGLKNKVYVSGIKAVVRFNILRFALKTNKKFKAPAIVASVPGNYDFNELLKQWETVRKSLREIINTFSADQKKVKVFTHPYSGDLNVIQTFTFILEHFRHHRKQIVKIMGKKF